MRWMMVILMMVALIFGAFPALAQDVTSEAPGDEVVVSSPGETIPLPDQQESIVMAMIVAVAAIIAVFSATLAFALKLLYNSAPPWAIELLKNNRGYIKTKADQLLDLGDTLAKSTKSTTLDDAAMESIRAEAERWFKQWFDEKAPPAGG